MSDFTASAAAGKTECAKLTAYEQLKLAFGPSFAGRPERSLWREFLTFVGAEGNTRLIAWELFSYANAYGLTHVRLRTVSDSAGVCLRSTKQEVATLKALGVLRWKRTRGASHYEFAINGRFPIPRSAGDAPLESRSAGDALLEVAGDARPEGHQ